jgi:hypothetical protein
MNLSNQKEEKMKKCMLPIMRILLLSVFLVSSHAEAQKMGPSVHRKVTAPTQDVLDYLKTFERHTFLNPTKMIANIVFSSQPLEFGLAAEKTYKLKNEFTIGDEIEYRAYRPTRHLDMMNQISSKSISKGSQIEIVVCKENGLRIETFGNDKNFKFIESYDLPEVECDQNRGWIHYPSDPPQISPKFEETMKKLGPGKYICKVYLFDKISPGRKPDPQRPLTHTITIDPDYDLVSVGQFTYIVK